MSSATNGNQYYSSQNNNGNFGNYYSQNGKDAQNLAMKKKAQNFYDQGYVKLALDTYTQIIASSPSDAIAYERRADCHMVLYNCRTALADAKTAIALCPNFIQAHCLVIRLAMMFDEEVTIQASFRKLQEIDPRNNTLQWYSSQRAMDDRSRELLSQSSGWLVDYPMALEAMISKARSLLHLRRVVDAAAVAKQILKISPEDSTSHFVLGKFFYDTDIDKSIFHYEKSFRFMSWQNDPEYVYYTNAKTFISEKTVANQVYASGDYIRAHELYRIALTVDLLNNAMRTTLLFNMSQASFRLRNYDICMMELNETLHSRPDYVKALMSRAHCYEYNKQYQKALEDLEAARDYEKDGPLRNEIADRLAYIRGLLNNPDDYYGILNVSRSASWAEITKVYWELMKEHHPDRHSKATEKVKQFHAAKCKLITRAYRILKEKLE